MDGSERQRPGPKPFTKPYKPGSMMAKWIERYERRQRDFAEMSRVATQNRLEMEPWETGRRLLKQVQRVLRDR